MIGVDDPNQQIELLLAPGHIHTATGQPDEVLGCHRRALAIAHILNQPRCQARILNGLAEAHNALGHRDRARDYREAALTILTDIGTTHVEETSADHIRVQLANLN